MFDHSLYFFHQCYNGRFRVSPRNVTCMLSPSDRRSYFHTRKRSNNLFVVTELLYEINHVARASFSDEQLE